MRVRARERIKAHSRTQGGEKALRMQGEILGASEGSGGISHSLHAQSG